MRKFYSFSLLMLLSMTLCSIVAVAKKFVTIDNIVYSVYGIEGGNMAWLTDGKSATGNVVIPAEVEYEGKKYPVEIIDSRAFMENTAITSVNIPASVESIFSSAFEGCTNLVSITGGAETLGNLWADAFKDTPWLANFPAEDGLKYWKGWVIGSDLPGGFDELHIKEGTIGLVPFTEPIHGKTLYIPKSFNSTFIDNFKVEKVVVDKENLTFFSDDYGAVYYKNYKESYRTETGNYINLTGQILCGVPTESPLDTFEVAEGTVAIEASACRYSNFENITVPEGCEALHWSSFSNLKRCKYIELPSTLKFLDLYHPQGDDNLEIVLKAKEVPTPDSNSEYRFRGCSHVTLYVPKESLEKYLADSRYKGKFKEIKAIPDDAPLKGDINGDGKVNAADVTTVYNYIANPEATGLTLDKVDINGDGNVNATDITDLYNIIQME